MSSGSAIRICQPRWGWIPVRVLIVTFLLTLLSFAVSLFLAIFGLFIAGAVSGLRPNMPTAYRHIALPFAAAMALVVLVATSVLEIRRFRQAKALAAIERAA
jgi:hypothetical protein